MTSDKPTQGSVESPSGMLVYLNGLNRRMEQAIDRHTHAISQGEYAVGIEQWHMLVLTGIAKSMYFLKTTEAWPEMVDGAIEFYSAKKPAQAEWICGGNVADMSEQERLRMQTLAYGRVIPANSYAPQEFIDGIISGEIRVRPSVYPLVQKHES